MRPSRRSRKSVHWFPWTKPMVLSHRWLPLFITVTVILWHLSAWIFRCPGVWQSIAKFIFAASINIVLVILVFSAGLFAVVRQRLIHPISLLNKASGEMVSNLASGEVFRIDVHTGDEIEELARSFEKMYEEVGDYIRRLSEVTAEKERIGAELSVATRISGEYAAKYFPSIPGSEGCGHLCNDASGEGGWRGLL